MTAAWVMTMNPSEMMILRCAVNALRSYLEREEADPEVSRLCSDLEEFVEGQHAINQIVWRLSNGVHN